MWTGGLILVSSDYFHEFFTWFCVTSRDKRSWRTAAMFAFVLTVSLYVQVCSACQQTGAIMGCFQKGCPRSYHYRCATQSGTVWNTGLKHLSAIRIVIVCFILVFESLPACLKCRSLTHRASLRCRSHSAWNPWWIFLVCVFFRLCFKRRQLLHSVSRAQGKKKCVSVGSWTTSRGH